jgi:hypothetical protein
VKELVQGSYGQTAPKRLMRSIENVPAVPRHGKANRS